MLNLPSRIEKIRLRKAKTEDSVVASQAEDFTLPPLFDAEWYLKSNPDVAQAGVDPLSHYLSHGSIEGRRPNPLFNPQWYRSVYPDVEAAGLEPLMHYARYGWRESRDPGPAFSTRAYRSANPDLGEDLNPLRHYLEFGRSEGRAPHPLLRLVDLAKPRVAIVIVSFNAATALNVTLSSLATAACYSPFEVLVVENGSFENERNAVRAAVDLYARAGLRVRLTQLSENLGFSGGNNVGLRATLAEDFTHICLLNSDVVVTDGWLDRLLDSTEPVVGPVSNSVGNEQTIPVDYEASLDPAAWPVINSFAQRRYAAWSSAVTYSDFLGFFCVLIRRDVVERVGELDEIFFPGSYEDDDYCVRLLAAGYRLAIARNVHVHHYGSASFGTLDMDYRLRLGNENRRRFEAKHGRRWSDRTHLILTSWAQDIAGERRGHGRVPADLLSWTEKRHHEVGTETVRRLVDSIAHLRAEQSLLADAAADRQPEQSRRERDELAPIDYGSPPRPVPLAIRATYSRLLRAFWTRLRNARKIDFSTLLAIQPLLAALAEVKGDRTSVLVFCTMDPTSADPKDGYVQRVLAMDRLLAGSARVYSCVSEERRGQPQIRPDKDGIWTVWTAEYDPVSDALLGAVADVSRLYVHSVLPLSRSSVRTIVREHWEQAMLDLHGAVPEEASMYDDPFGSQVYGEYEAEFAPSVGKLVCVSRAMARHVRAKHGPTRSQPVICPIFLDRTIDRTPRAISRLRPRAIYAGGAQRWQQIPKMLDLIVRTSSWCDYVVLTPNVSEIHAGFAALGTSAEDHGVTVRAAEHAEVLSMLPQFQYGLLLRQDSVVNDVSCPTKMIEYVASGVVPILDSVRIGDFVEDGLCYVALDAFAAGRVPSPDERHVLARRNLDLAVEFGRRSRTGQAAIRDWAGCAVLGQNGAE